jgi:hypothetical protein
MYTRDMAPCDSLERLKLEILASDEESTADVPRPQQSQLPLSGTRCIGVPGITHRYPSHEPLVAGVRGGLAS